jgi:Beta-lactamase
VFGVRRGSGQITGVERSRQVGYAILEIGMRSLDRAESVTRCVAGVGESTTANWAEIWRPRASDSQGRDGGTGRRSGLKIRRSQGRGGSTPPPGTIQNKRGLDSFESDPEVGNVRHFDNGIEGGLKFFVNDPLLAQPGTHFNYSTQGYTLAGCAMEGASGKKYADAVRENVLVPAGMLQTRPDDRFAIIPLRSRFYAHHTGMQGSDRRRSRFKATSKASC